MLNKDVLCSVCFVCVYVSLYVYGCKAEREENVSIKYFMADDVF